MPDTDPPPLEIHEISLIQAEIRGLQATLPVFRPGETTPPRYFQASIQKNLEWAQRTLERFTASFRRYEADNANQTRIALGMSALRNIISELKRYDRRVEEMRMQQGEHVSAADIFRTGGYEGPRAEHLLNGPQRFTYYDPPK